MNVEKIEINLQKLMSFDWKYNELMQEEYISYVKDFLSKSAVWSVKIKKTKEFPFFDFAKCVGEFEEIKSFYHQKLENYFDNFYYISSQVKATCHWYLEWSTACDNSKIKSLNLPDPFKPLISLYERGGHFRVENRFIWLNNLGLQIGDYSKYLPLDSINP